MSIINDALKKTQEKLSGSSDKNTGTPQAKQPNGPSGNSSNNTPMIFLMVLLTLGCVYWVTLELKPQITELAGMFDVNTRSSSPAETPQAQTEQPVKKILPQPSTSTAEPQTDSLENLNLTGIIYSEDGNAVLLNNNIYEVGESVDGYKVIEILPKSVKLEKNGKIFELKARN